jgi:hypothetical protein
LSLADNRIDTTKNSLKIISHASSLAASSIDFPLLFKLEILKPERVYKLLLSAKDENGKIKSNKIINSNINGITDIYLDSLATGTYFTSVELYDYNGDVITSETIKLLVN